MYVILALSLYISISFSIILSMFLDKSALTLTHALRLYSGMITSNLKSALKGRSSKPVISKFAYSVLSLLILLLPQPD
ncbi:MAG: hypothetical protein E7L05_10155, partial [Clostridium sp.]|nr:hypothetical protein [Clostridium sp.]